MKSNFLFLILLAVMLSYCSDKKQETSAVNEDPTADPAKRTAFCLWENIAVRDAPSADGKYLTALSIGEQVEYLDSTVTESSDKNYSYTLLRLSDGKEGWARADFLFPDVALVTLREKSKIYSRPDLLTASRDSFEPMDLAVIKNKQDDWLEVTGVPRGSTWFKTGWIQQSSIYDDPTAVKVAALASKAMKQEDVGRKKEIFALISEDEDLGRYFSNEIEALQLTDKAFFIEEKDLSIYECMISDEGGNPFSYPGEFEINNVRMGPGGNEIYADGTLYWSVSACIALNQGYARDEYGYVGYEERLASLKKASGHAMFTKNTNDGADFQYVNPEFVNWVTTKMLPHPEQKIYGVSFQKVYDALLKENARGWVRAYLVFRKYDNAVSAYTSVYQSDGHAGMYLLEAYEQDRIHQAIDPFRVGFWIRRTIDGSAPALERGLRKIMLNYDREWFENEMSAAESTFGQMNALVW